MDPSSSSIKQFMKYIDNAHDVGSIMLQCVPLKDALKSPSMQIPSECAFFIAEICPCNIPECNCNCIVFSTVEDITFLINRRMPDTPKQLFDSMCILPSLQCMKNGCDGLNQCSSEFPAACEVLDFELKPPIQEIPIFICIPLLPASIDEWTSLLMRYFKAKDQEDRGAIVMASDALEDYLDQNGGGRLEEVFYKTTSGAKC